MKYSEHQSIPPTDIHGYIAGKPLCKRCGKPADQLIQSMHPECHEAHRAERQALARTPKGV